MALVASARPQPPFRDLQPSEIFLPAPWAPQMQETVDEILQSYDGKLFLYVSDPWRGYRFGYRADEPAYLASGVKVAFMIEVYRQREMGELSLDEDVSYTDADIRDGAPRINRLKPGTRVKVGKLLDWMMRSSDNAASDMLARRVGLTRVREGLEAHGIFGFTPLTYLIDVRRGVYREMNVLADDLTPRQVRNIRWTPIWEPQLRKLEASLGQVPGSFTREALWAAYERFYATKVNAAPMASVGLLFEKLCRGEIVNRAASKEMLQLMAAARTSRHRIMGMLPSGTRVSHKTGSQFRRICDLGVVTLSDGHPLVISACAESGDVNGSEVVMARLARRAYDLALADHRIR